LARARSHGAQLIPALYHLLQGQADAAGIRIVGFCPARKDDESWRQEMRAALNHFSRSKPVDDKVWSAFWAATFFMCRGDLADAQPTKSVEGMLTLVRSGPLRETCCLSRHAAEPSSAKSSRKFIAPAAEQGRGRLAAACRREAVRP